MSRAGLYSSSCSVLSALSYLLPTTRRTCHPAPPSGKTVATAGPQSWHMIIVNLACAGWLRSSERWMKTRVRKEMTVHG